MIFTFIMVLLALISAVRPPACPQIMSLPDVYKISQSIAEVMVLKPFAQTIIFPQILQGWNWRLCFMRRGLSFCLYYMIYRVMYAAFGAEKFYIVPWV